TGTAGESKEAHSPRSSPFRFDGGANPTKRRRPRRRSHGSLLAGAPFSSREQRDVERARKGRERGGDPREHATATTHPPAHQKKKKKEGINKRNCVINPAFPPRHNPSLHQSSEREVPFDTAQNKNQKIPASTGPST
ncbi:hypothetical protein IscW_ISCW023446, partial [Ixodes scapularis]